MPPNTSPAIPETIPTLQEIRTCSEADIISICSSITELDSQLPHDYLAEIDDNERVICLRASLICWKVTQGKQVPRKMQLQAILADRLNQDSLVSAGTGSGKTLPIAINILLDDPANSPITLTISPLTRLQSSQVESFGERYGIKTFAINQYTPRDAAWWAVNYPAIGAPKPKAQHLIVTVEQFFKSSADGHIPHMGILACTPAFQKRIVRINIDEAHFFYTAGLPLYGQPAFRPAWGMLAELKIILRRTILWHLFSATFPKHILTAVATKIDDPHNYECFLTFPFDLESQPHVLIFVDDKALAAKITNHLDSSYLEQTHNDFVSPTGTCRILVSTSGESVGVDFPNVQIVCTAGLPSTIVDALQRAGRAIRTGNEPALFVLFHESWALEIDPDDYMEGTDPDRPRSNLDTHSRQRDRAPLSVVRLIRCSSCLRQFFTDYLNDQSTIGTLLLFLL
ncbi:P-loop containing nucleoside triphosphate hydrolase protein [Pholiota molesta]|nr:P-loop containing nucleoside triphosphate hydrolase protein [Pholiota molesta]